MDKQAHDGPSTLGNAVFNEEETVRRVNSQAKRIMLAYPSELRHSHHWEGRDYIVGPTIENVTVRSVTGQSGVFDVTLLELPGRTGRKSQETQYFLAYDHNYNPPGIPIPTTPTYGVPMLDPSRDTSIHEIDTMLNRIEANVEQLIEQRKQTARQRRVTQRRRLKKAFATTGTVVATAAILGGTFFGVIKWNQNEDAKDRAAADAAAAEAAAADKAHWDAIAQYDGRGIILQSRLVGPNDAAVAVNDRFAFSLIDETPPFEDLLDNPRKLKISADDDLNVATVPFGKGVRVASNAPKGHVTYTVMEDGTIWLNALPVELDADDIAPSYDVIIQTQDLADTPPK